METRVPTIVLGTRRVGPGEPCFVIAEAGSNHNGDLSTAFALIDVAADAGADAVKFQMFRSAALYPPNAGAIDLKRVGAPIHAALASLELPVAWLGPLRERADTRGIDLLMSVFDETSADAARPYVRAFKIASYELTHHPLLRHIARIGLPVIMSTGAAVLGEVADAVAVLRAAGSENFVLLQCTAEYPAPVHALDLQVIRTMRERFGVATGLSDHSRDPVVAPLVAIGLGACVIEKHFTLSNRMPGPDHEFALEPAELKSMIERVRLAERALGTGTKDVNPVEVRRRAFGRRTIFSTEAIRKGERFSAQNVAVLRCGEHPPGLPPNALEQVFAATSARAIEAYRPLQEEDLSAYTRAR